MKAWLFTILRNTHTTNWRRTGTVVEDPDGLLASRLQIEPTQPWRVEYRDVLKAIEQLDPATRHALLLMGAGLSYQEAAEVCRCPVRTLQSRVRRGRQRLARMIE